MKKVLKDKLNILIIFISIFLILLCFNRSLWGDEAWTAIIMKYDFKEMIREIGQDVHPPLYFVLLKQSFLWLLEKNILNIFLKVILLQVFLFV